MKGRAGRPHMETAAERLVSGLAVDRAGDDTDWRARAECATGQYPADMWFPKPLPGKQRTDYSLPQSVCVKHCPVRTECLSYALAADEPEGVWGGATPSQRQAMKATARRTGTGDAA